MTKRAFIIVSGKVQGVSFRWFVKEEALNRGLFGTVRNLPDTTVEIDVEGDEDKIHSLLKTLKTGNGYSRVDDFTLNWFEPQNIKTSFNIIF